MIELYQFSRGGGITPISVMSDAGAKEPVVATARAAVVSAHPAGVTEAQVTAIVGGGAGLAAQHLRDFGFGDVWVNLQSPTAEELARASAEFGVPLDFLQDCLDPQERPHALSDEGICMIICKVSAKNADDAGRPFLTVPLGVVITRDAVLTVCSRPGIAKEFVFKAWSGHGGKVSAPVSADSGMCDQVKTTKSAKASKNATGKACIDKNDNGRFRPGVELALRLLQECGIRFIRHLQELDLLTEDIEQRMHRSMRNEDLAVMMQVEKCLVYFTTSLKGNLGVLEKIGSNQLFTLHDNEKQLLTDAMIECKQAADTGQVYLDILSSISDTSASMISNSMNSIMKFLTAITLLMTVPTVIVGVFGMNVPLPFQESPLALLLILVFTFVLCWLLWKYFVKKHWM